MRKLAFVLLAVVCCVSFIGSVYAAALEKGEMVYVRSNLHADGNVVFWHNMRIFKTVIPVGTEVKIERSSGGRTTFVTVDTTKTFRVVADTNQWDKFFVKERREIGLDRLSSSTKTKVENGEVVNGMTKEEVYASKGCPAYIAWGKTTEKKSLADIMQSDKWYYMNNSRGHDVMVTFENGAVVKTGGFEK
ncbi:MAG: hypothetical protein Q8R55_02495 [Candidatus Taylorbacteria bacterium]|nr:hypothetical protein [Candidatus Taylorbacteria bacterium]